MEEKVYYAFVDKIEIIKKQAHLFFDCVKANLVEKQNLHESDNFQTHLIYLKTTKNLLRKIYRNKISPSIESRWVKIFTNTKGQKANIYTDDDRASNQIYIKKIELLNRRKKENKEILNYLLSTVSLNEYGDADINSIKNILKIKRIEIIGILNVGQGNMIVFYNKNNKNFNPALYFDVGGGYGPNYHTYQSINRWANHEEDQNNIVILSHWHRDHYETAIRINEYSKKKWIVPRQSIGPTSLKLVKSINKKGKLFIWPRKTKNLSIGEFEISNCTGINKNDSGIALSFNKKDQNLYARLLFPADAKYSHIPFQKKRKYSVIVATHHGGRLGSLLSIPSPSMPNWIIYSFGEENIYNLPDIISIKNYEKKGWKNKRKTTKSNIFISISKSRREFNKIKLWVCLHGENSKKIISL